MSCVTQRRRPRSARTIPTAGILRLPLGRVCRETRLRLDLSQDEIAIRAGVTRSYLAKIERGEGNPTIDVVVALAEALGLDIELVARGPIFLGSRTRQDRVHALCSGHVERRLRGAGWSTQHEVEIIDGRYRGWIDILAFDPRTSTLLIIEIKTRLDDIGAIERQVGWYERVAHKTATRYGWEPRRVETWLLVLSTEEAENWIREQRAVLGRSFPARASAMTEVSEGRARAGNEARGLAVINPASHGRRWLIRARVDGRRSPSPYRDYADAAKVLGGGGGTVRRGSAGPRATGFMTDAS